MPNQGSHSPPMKPVPPSHPTHPPQQNAGHVLCSRGALPRRWLCRVCRVALPLPRRRRGALLGGGGPLPGERGLGLEAEDGLKAGRARCCAAQQRPLSASTGCNDWSEQTTATPAAATPAAAPVPAFCVHSCTATAMVLQVYWNDDEGSGPGEWWLGCIVEDTRGGGCAPAAPPRRHSFELNRSSQRVRRRAWTLHRSLLLPLATLFSICSRLGSSLSKWVLGCRDAEVLRDPYGAGGLWERFRVEWEGAPCDSTSCGRPSPPCAALQRAVRGGVHSCWPPLPGPFKGSSATVPLAACAGVASPGGGLAQERQAEAQQHSPWELFPPGGAQAAAAAECPRLDAELAQRMQAAVQARRCLLCCWPGTAVRCWDTS